MNKDQSPGVIQIKSHSLELNAEERTRDRERMNEKNRGKQIKENVYDSIHYVCRLVDRTFYRLSQSKFESTATYCHYKYQFCEC